ncbi:hypothetical protein EJB05_03833, partial [Eragrostis curvula]
MEFSMELYDVDEAKQHTNPSSSAANDGDDRISGLGDDVLLHILGLLRDARDLLPTGVLSRQWRGLWRRVPALTFSPWPQQLTDSASFAQQRYIAFVSDVLSLRAKSSDAIERLAISLVIYNSCGKHLVPSSIGAAERWIQYAVRQGVKSFDLKLLPDEEDRGRKKKTRDRGDRERFAMALDELLLPSSAKLETLRLDLSNAIVRLPATVVLPSLVDLTLESVEVTGDSGDSGGSNPFAGLLSSPRLQKLRLYDITLTGFQEMLLIESASLVELSLENMYEMESLDLRTPNLRVLRIEDCKDIEALTVSAPRLEELELSSNPSLVHIEGELCCSRLNNLGLSSHGCMANGNDRSTHLLQHCSSVRDLTLSLTLKRNKWRCIDIIKGRVPQLPNVTSLAIEVCLPREQHSLLGDSLATLLTGFNNLRYLDIQLYSSYNPYQRAGVPFDVDAGTSTSLSDRTYGCSPNKILSLVHLQEAKFRGLIESEDCELPFLQSVLAGARNLRKVVVCFDAEYSRKSGRDEFRHMLLGGGTWTPCRDACESYEWRP